MNERLKKYFDSLFEGAPDTKESQELKEEIFLNTLDKYNDLLSQGKSEEASFTQAVARIGDIDELIALCNIKRQTNNKNYYSEKILSENKKKQNIFLLITVALYFICVLIPIAFYEFNMFLGTVIMVFVIGITTGIALYSINLKIDAECFSRVIDSLKITKGDEYSVEDFEKKRKFDNAILSSAVTLLIVSFIPFIIYMNFKVHGNIIAITTLIMLAAAISAIFFYKANRFNTKKFSSDTMVNEFKKWNKFNKKTRPVIVFYDIVIYIIMFLLFAFTGRLHNWLLLLLNFAIAFVLTRIVREFFKLAQALKK